MIVAVVPADFGSGSEAGTGLPLAIWQYRGSDKTHYSALISNLLQSFNKSVRSILSRSEEGRWEACLGV